MATIEERQNEARKSGALKSFYNGKSITYGTKHTIEKHERKAKSEALKKKMDKNIKEKGWNDDPHLGYYLRNKK